MKKSMKFEEWKELVAKNRQALNSKSNIFNTEPESLTYAGSKNSPRYNPAPKSIDGHEYVDLELPSGTLWATMNIGADTPYDFGLYFQWGDVQGYPNTTEKEFTQDDYKWADEEDRTNYSKYNRTDKINNLYLEDDAAVANWSVNWKIPTKDQFRELVENTTAERFSPSETPFGVDFIKRTSKKNPSKYIILPGAGSIVGDEYRAQTRAEYWSSTIDPVYDQHYVPIYNDLFNSWREGSELRHIGLPIRPVVNTEIPYVTVVYDIQDISQPTRLFTSPNISALFFYMDIDGVACDTVEYQHQFDSEGEHVVKLLLKDPTTFGATTSEPLFNMLDYVTNVDLPEGITTIKQNAFLSMMNLSNIVIPNSVTTIGVAAFNHTFDPAIVKLKSITIPENVVSIGNGAFSSSLTECIMRPTVPPQIESGTFSQTSDVLIYVPSELVQTYKDAWNFWIADHIVPITE